MEKLEVAKRASRGIAMAPAYLFMEPDLTPLQDVIQEEQVESEKNKFAEAKAIVTKELSCLAKESEIFAAHVEIVNDFTLQDSVDMKIMMEKKNVQAALGETIKELSDIFAGMDDAYMKERGADICDVGKRLMAALKGVTLPDLGSIQKEVIVVAKDLFPSDTVSLNTDYVKGIITEEGGVTSHVSIIAKSLNIPTLVGVQDILSKVQENRMICMDAGVGSIILEPTATVLQTYKEKREAYEKERERLERMRTRLPVTKDGKRIYLCANVGGIEDIEKALEMNIDGVGLFRSEFLYMENDHFPTENEQFEVYQRAARLSPKELTIRTLDIGGDKDLSYFDFEKEENPFLGWRAIRISLEKKEMFKEQLRAILRASIYGHVRIMFPMIISLEELEEAKEVVDDCKNELRQEGLVFDEAIEIGMMMETPASVILAEEFAREVDFFSIGTNDLTQYLLAVDRGNKRIADRYSYFHPAVLKAIYHIIEAGHKEGITVGMCGEMAGDVTATDQLLAMGLDEFSMSAGSMDYVRERILNY